MWKAFLNWFQTPKKALNNRQGFIIKCEQCSVRFTQRAAPQKYTGLGARQENEKSRLGSKKGGKKCNAESRLRRKNIK